MRNSNRAGNWIVPQAFTLLMSNTVASNAATSFHIVNGSQSFNISEADANQLINQNGKIRNMKINLATAAGAAASGKGWVITLRKNGADTVITATIMNDETTGEDTTNIVQLTAGDVICIKTDAVLGTETQDQRAISFEFYPD